MKQLSASWWARAAAAADLATEGELLTALRARLGDGPDARARLAAELDVTPFQLSGFLRGRWPVSDAIAEKLGYRKVVRFERVE